jgi:hypothetical protein
MSLLHRFRHTAAMLLVHHYNGKQDPLAVELRDELNLGEDLDLRPAVSRYISGATADSGFFDPIHLVFWRDVVAGDYPLPFLGWLERAYASYDLDNSPGKRDQAKVRTLLAEARMLFQLPTKASDQAPRAEAARHLMLGIAVGVEQRTLGTTQARLREGLQHLRTAVSLFRTLKPKESALSNSDKFHTACAVHMADWLLSELKDEESRKRTLKELAASGAIGAYAWLAETTRNWVYTYGVAEIYGELGDPDVSKLLRQAIELNPRLANFALETGFDGVDEPLDKAPALQQAISNIAQNHKSWLEQRIEAYKRNADLYKEDVAKGIKAMLDDLKATKPAKKVAMKRAIAVAIVAIAALMASDIFLHAAAFAKPIF